MLRFVFLCYCLNTVLEKVVIFQWFGSSLTLSWRRPLSYRNQSIDLLHKSMDWFLYDNGLRHERVKCFCYKMPNTLVLLSYNVTETITVLKDVRGILIKRWVWIGFWITYRRKLLVFCELIVIQLILLMQFC